jgi:hypothetical protein
MDADIYLPPSARFFPPKAQQPFSWMQLHVGIANNAPYTGATYERKGSKELSSKLSHFAERSLWATVAGFGALLSDSGTLDEQQSLIKRDRSFCVCGLLSR